jgi:hypothetical protein
MSKKNPLTPAGIEPGTLRFVSKHLNHCATAVPFSYLSILLHTWLFLNLCPVTILLFAIQLTFCIPYQMLLTTLIRKHIYSNISENNFVPSKQIIVPTGYNLASTLYTQCSSWWHAAQRWWLFQFAVSGGSHINLFIAFNIKFLLPTSNKSAGNTFSASSHESRLRYTFREPRSLTVRLAERKVLITYVR